MINKNKKSLKYQTCMDEDDPQSAQSLPIDFIQLLQGIQSGASIPLNTRSFKYYKYKCCALLILSNR